MIDAKGMADYLDFINAPHFKDEKDFHSGVDGALELLEDIVGRRIPGRTQLFLKYATDAMRRTPQVHVTNLRQLIADTAETGNELVVRPLVVVIDEFAELVLASGDRRRFEALVTRFVQLARSIGGHLIAATQRPSTDVVTGVMKANFARVGLRVQQGVDSRVILDEHGAESLLGRGDLLFKASDVGLVRLQGFSAVGPFDF
jgi:S-DNA-T family DNA segregation ATPase FtsK/SpoIIIE